MLFSRSNKHEGQAGRDLVEKGALLLDVRTREEFAGGHVRGAVNIPVQELANRLHEISDAGRGVVVYCRSGARSAMAAGMLRGAGFRVEDVGPMPRW